MKATLETLVTKREDTLSSEVDDEFVLMNLDNGAFYGLNPVATKVLKFMETPRRAHEIRDHLLSLYDVDAATCEAQLLALLDEMAAEDLLVLDDGAGGHPTEAT